MGIGKFPNKTINIKNGKAEIVKVLNINKSIVFQHYLNQAFLLQLDSS